MCSAEPAGLQTESYSWDAASECWAQGQFICTRMLLTVEGQPAPSELGFKVGQEKPLARGVVE